MRTDQINTALRRTLSDERLRRYVIACDGDLDRALSLYERNLRLAEAFHTPLHCLEITLRNVIDDRMNAKYGRDWLRGSAPLEDDARLAIARADETLAHSSHTEGAVVAELALGFWVGLLGPRYDATLWRATLHAGFRASGRGLRRSVVHGRMNALRRFRNRVAHHEPIFDRGPVQIHGEILEAITWMCPLTAAWTADHSRFDLVVAAP